MKTTDTTVEPEQIDPDSVHIETDGVTVFGRDDRVLSDEEWASIRKHVLYPHLVVVTLASVPIVWIDLFMWPLALTSWLLGAWIWVRFFVACAWLLDNLIRIRLPVALKGAIAGGVCTSFWPTIVMMLSAVEINELLSSFAIAAQTVVVCVVTTIGQYAGAIGGWKSGTGRVLVFDHGSGRRYFTTLPRQDIERMQFTNGQMLCATVLLALLLGFVKPFGGLSVVVLLYAIVWATIQFVSLWMGYLVWPRYVAWRTSSSR